MGGTLKLCRQSKPHHFGYRAHIENIAIHNGQLFALLLTVEIAPQRLRYLFIGSSDAEHVIWVSLCKIDRRYRGHELDHTGLRINGRSVHRHVGA